MNSIINSKDIWRDLANLLQEKLEKQIDQVFLKIYPVIGTHPLSIHNIFKSITLETNEHFLIATVNFKKQEIIYSNYGISPPNQGISIPQMTIKSKDISGTHFVLASPEQPSSELCHFLIGALRLLFGQACAWGKPYESIYNIKTAALQHKTKVCRAYQPELDGPFIDKDTTSKEVQLPNLINKILTHKDKKRICFSLELFNQACEEAIEPIDFKLVFFLYWSAIERLCDTQE